jgi:protein TonB
MQYTNAITRQPIIIGLLLSIAVHAAVLYIRSLYTPPMPHMATGRTVVQLTLLPSMNHPESTPEMISAPPFEELALQPETISTTAEVMHETATAESIEQEATLREDKGVITEAVADGAFHPAYPRISKRRGEEGTVMLSVQVLKNGSVGKAGILQSSGFRRLDEAAVKGAMQTTFTPAVRLGHPVESTTRLSYTFRLTDD